MDMSSTFIDLNVVVKKSDNEMPSLTDGISHENCVLHNLNLQISVYVNRTLVSTSSNLSNYTSNIQFMLMARNSYKNLRVQPMDMNRRQTLTL